MTFPVWFLFRYFTFLRIIEGTQDILHNEIYLEIYLIDIRKFLIFRDVGVPTLAELTMLILGL